MAQDEEMAFGSEIPANDSLSAQLQELDDKLKSGMISKKEYDELCSKLESADADIDYAETPKEFEMGANVSMTGRHGGRASDESIGGGLEDAYDPPQNLNIWQGQGGTTGRWGGRAGDSSAKDNTDCPALDGTLTPGEQTRFDMLKETKRNGVLSPSEQKEFEGLRDKVGRLGFKSAGATRARDGMATDPPVSEAQRRAMFAAKSGKSNIGIPKSVGTEFAEADPGGKLPEKVG